jgi:hypothetical protein
MKDCRGIFGKANGEGGRKERRGDVKTVDPWDFFLCPEHNVKTIGRLSNLTQYILRATVLHTQFK